MAIDTHIKFDGVEGESTHTDHKGEIELLSWSWGVSNASMGSGGGKVFELWEESLNGFMQDFEDVLGTDFYADGTAAGADEATPIEGLGSIIDDNNTHMGVNRSTDTWWAANVRTVANNFLDDDNADGVCNGIVAMRLGYLDACAGGDVGQSSISKTIQVKKSKPDAAFTTLTAFNNYCLALQPQQQFVGGGKNDAGQEVAFWGLPLRWDTYCTADTLFFVNSKFFNVRVVGDTLIYRDIEDELGTTGTPRARAIGLAAQLQAFSEQPRLFARVDNMD